jgi:hypothetical protein
MRDLCQEVAVSQWIGLTVVAAAVAVMAWGCGQQPAALPLRSPPIQTETFDRAFIP